MANLKHSDIRTIDDAFQADPGYCLNFSDRTFREWFDDEFKIDIYEERYRANGTSKMNRLRTFFKASEPMLAARVMRTLWEYRESTFRPHENPKVKDRLIDLIARLEGPSMTGRYTPDRANIHDACAARRASSATISVLEIGGHFIEILVRPKQHRALTA
jgi:hypothetical protein